MASFGPPKTFYFQNIKSIWKLRFFEIHDECVRPLFPFNVTLLGDRESLFVSLFGGNNLLFCIGFGDPYLRDSEDGGAIERSLSAGGGRCSVAQPLAFTFHCPETM
jgi:hypothetical protein